jgi:hypothetical protein
MKARSPGGYFPPKGLAALLHDLAVELEIAVQVADTAQGAWCWKNVKRR